jgi:enamine deaminase RidA (YjgF/YER057c/UK114 family)
MRVRSRHHSATFNHFGHDVFMSTFQDKLLQLGLTLPQAPKPVASYIPAVRSGNLVFVSGQLPFKDGALLATGAVPSVVPVEAAQQAARQCVLNGLAVVGDQLEGDFSRVVRIVRVGVFVCSDVGFTEQPKVANGGSELLQALFGEAGRHARAAVGTNALPLGASVEIELVVEVR